MRNKILICIFLLISSCLAAQTEAKLKLRDDTQKNLCYDGLATRNTKVEFKNLSTCGSNDCFYVWNYGDSSQDSLVITRDITADGVHEYTTDGLFPVSLMVVDRTSIPDSIKNAKIKAIEYLSTTKDDSVNISVNYTGSDKTDRQTTVKIPVSQFSKKNLPYSIEVYSPYTAEQNFSCTVDDPSSEDDHAAIESFVYILSVNQENFTPHKKDVWKYYWSIYDNKTLVNSFVLDSAEYRYTFPKENYKPGYTVSLKIALDSSKFDPDDISYYELEECVSEQSQIIKVTDYFFSDSTRMKDDVDDRETSIPNIFTPGGNDENDVFYFNTNGVDEFSIWIYNNNGNLVYKQTAETISWTGHDNSGKKCPSGTYYYVVKSTNKDKRHNTAGFIQLFRQD